MEDISSADQDYKLGVLLHQARDAVFKARDKELRQHGISSPIQAAVLFIVRAIGGEATPAKISRWLLREPHSVSAILNRMEKEGLVRKTKDLEKKNLIRVTLTEKGQKAYDQSRESKCIKRILSSLSKEQQEQLLLLLWTLRNKALEELGMEGKIPFP